jgi:small-conductance mechanosensitive channel
LLPVLFILFGVPGETVRDLGGQALFGFNIGGVHIPSVAKLIYAIIVFVIVMAATRLVQTGVKRGPLAHSRADVGVQNSLITLLGYAGLVVALFLGISTLGFDLSNLALIAGALSVGIGFGLQSIVNNFVSGLILLFERPIKVGDWIITTSGEGTVKKISVRSTEIETFDRASIIIPNSELISASVTNWTHKSKLGRIIVPVGVSYNADPEIVKEILLKCADDHPKIISYPEPFVAWMDFGASSLDFELRAFLRDISEGLMVRTELRFAIFKALAEAGIEIPFPQRDVHVKSWPQERQGAKPEDKNGESDA